MPDKYDWQEKLFVIARTLTVLFPVLLLSSVAADIALCIIAFCFIVHSGMQKEWGWIGEPWVCLLSLLWLYMIARGLCTTYPKEAMSRALPFGRYILFAAALARWTLAHAATRQRLFRVLLVMVAACALDGLIQYVAGHDILFRPIIHDPHAGHIRLTGPFTKPILGIMLAWLAFPALLPFLFAPRGDTKRPVKQLLAGIACSMVIMAAIALSGERMALLLTLMGMAIAGALLRMRLRFLLAGAAGVIALLILLAVASPGMFARQVESTETTLSHWQESPYGMLLKSDLALAGLHPIIGVGAGQFKYSCETLYAGDEARTQSMCNTHPHNIYLEWLIEEGILGFVLFVAFIAAVMKNSLCSIWHKPVNPLAAGLFIAFILRIWPFMSTTNFFSRWGAPPFWLVLGALLVYTAGKGVKNASASLSLEDSGF